jgi:restriction endonuclease S subunit
MKLVRRRLGDIAQIVGGATPSTKVPEYWDGGIPWITPKDLSGFDGTYIENGSRSISQAGVEQSSVKMLPAGTVLYTSRAPIGYVAIASAPVTTNQGFKSLVLYDGYVSEFIYYLLKYSKSEIESHSSGGTFAEISAKALAEVEVEIPDERHQLAISDVLLNLDKKILVNQRISKTLESIAQVIFKSWFVDFDPVKSKMAGKVPIGFDDATAALFPDSMEDSELGQIPSNWHAAPLTDMFEVLSGGTPKTTEKSYWGGEIPWFSVVDAPDSGGCFFTKTEKTITELGLAKSAAKMVRAGVTIISARGTVGKTAIVASPSTFNQSCYGLMGKYGDFYTYLLVRYMVMKLQNIAHGGMFDTITRDTFAALKAPKPSEQVIRKFEELAEPMFMQIRSLQYQSDRLLAIRNALLPRLISGELQIPEEMLAS